MQRKCRNYRVVIHSGGVDGGSSLIQQLLLTLLSVLPQAGPEEEGGRVKTKPVSSSTGEGAGTAAGKRSAQHLASEDVDDKSDSSDSPPAPRKISKIGFGLSSQMGKKSNPISIKLGATVSCL